jgi:hypothetical protein
VLRVVFHLVASSSLGISTPHPPCEQWLAAAEVGAGVVLSSWSWVAWVLLPVVVVDAVAGGWSVVMQWVMGTY